MDTRIKNHFNKETFVFTHPYDDEVLSRMDVILDAGGSGGGNAVTRIHPCPDEIFSVHYGRLEVVLDGVDHIVEAGRSVTVPKGVPHFFRNAHDGETPATVTFTETPQHQRFFLNLALWTRDNPAYVSDKGEGKLLAMALFLDACRDHLYIAGLPVWAQKIMFPGLSVVARHLHRRAPSGSAEIAPAQSLPRWRSRPATSCAASLSHSRMTCNAWYTATRAFFGNLLEDGVWRQALV